MPLRLGSLTPAALRVGALEVTAAYLGSNLVYTSTPPEFWQPSQLDGLTLWLDAYDASTITLNGSDVSQWSDKSGNAHNAIQSTASLQPAYQTTGFNNKPTVNFDTTNLLQFASSMFTNPSRLYGTSVVQGNAANSGVIFSHRSSSVELVQFAMQGSTSLIAGSKLQMRGSGNVLQEAIIDHNSNLPHIYEASFDKPASSHFVRINATLQQTNTYNFGSETFNATIQLIGGFNSGTTTANFNGKMSEFILLQSTPSVEDQQNIQGYLAWKWGSA